MKRAGRTQTALLSVKSQRWLQAAGIEKALAAGDTIVPVGRTYRLRDGQLATLAFIRDDEARLCVGYAVDEGEWVMVESEPFSARTLGYYERWLKRHRELGA
ncbi:MAG: hypothetical protein HYR72_15490 [Deltaproteobacteria bacterium]|nr:hypothetical protein [Deltaproteobacteria bacterium]MBI3387373.1 hypothetical protein [Deltaproteobacteria bacterium]